MLAISRIRTADTCRLLVWHLRLTSPDAGLGGLAYSAEELKKARADSVLRCWHC